MLGMMMDLLVYVLQRRFGLFHALHFNPRLLARQFCILQTSLKPGQSGASEAVVFESRIAAPPRVLDALSFHRVGENQRTQISGGAAIPLLA